MLGEAAPPFTKRKDLFELMCISFVISKSVTQSIGHYTKKKKKKIESSRIFHEHKERA